jgi:hypothetical protein
MKHHKWQEVEHMRTEASKTFKCSRCGLVTGTGRNATLRSLKSYLKGLSLNSNCNSRIIEKVMNS